MINHNLILDPDLDLHHCLTFTLTWAKPLVPDLYLPQCCANSGPCP